MSRKAAGYKNKDFGNRIASSTKNPVDKLPLSKRLYVKARAGGANKDQSAKIANVSNRMAHNYESDADVQAAYRSLMRKAIPAKKLVALIKGGSEAKMPVFSPDGKKISERADWKTRKPYIEMAAKHAGYHEEKNNQGGGNQIVLTVNHIGQPHVQPTVKVIEASND